MSAQPKPWYCIDCDDESRFIDGAVCDSCGIDANTLRAYIAER
jgi:hypothetical protein